MPSSPAAGHAGATVHGTMSIEPVRRVSAAWGGAFDLHVALPASYRTARHARYPVLWLVEGASTFHGVLGQLNTGVHRGHAPELIVVDVRQAGACHGASPWAGADAAFDEQQAEDFLDLLAEARTVLGSRYRMDDDHGVAGHDAGAAVVLRALLGRPGAFRRFIAGSLPGGPSKPAAGRLQPAPAGAVQGPEADVFIGTSAGQMSQALGDTWGLLAPGLQGEAGSRGRFHRLKITAQVFAHRHPLDAMADVTAAGIRAVWADKMERPQPAAA